jgi:ubiquinone/menaquinone biosynthesis C-methylase UbiE
MQTTTMIFIKKKTYIKEVKFLASILKFQKDKSYFDYGCGTFEHSIKLLNKVKKIIGIDYSKLMIEISREKIKKIKKIQIEQVKKETSNN